MTTDNRANEPTEAQGVAATVALARSIHGNGADHEDFDYYRKHVDAALVAAQGAAPQAESSHTSSYINPSLPGMIRNLWKSDPSENSVRTALKLAGDLIQELIDLKAAPVLPSSTVDEDALAEVIARSRGFGNGWEQIPPLTRGAYREVARAVAEWLKGQGGESRAER